MTAKNRKVSNEAHAGRCTKRNVTTTKRAR
jgi:hypothetical protein